MRVGQSGEQLGHNGMFSSLLAHPQSPDAISEAMTQHIGVPPATILIADADVESADVSNPS